MDGRPPGGSSASSGRAPAPSGSRDTGASSSTWKPPERNRSIVGGRVWRRETAWRSRRTTAGSSRSRNPQSRSRRNSSCRLSRGLPRFSRQWEPVSTRTPGALFRSWSAASRPNGTSFSNSSGTTFPFSPAGNGPDERDPGAPIETVSPIGVAAGGGGDRPSASALRGKSVPRRRPALHQDGGPDPGAPSRFLRVLRELVRDRATDVEGDQESAARFVLSGSRHHARRTGRTGGASRISPP